MMKRIILIFTLLFYAFSAQAYNGLFSYQDGKDILSDKAEAIHTSVYDRPYSLTENDVDTQLLKRNTGMLFGVGFGTMVFLYAMPTSFTNWDDEDDDDKNPFSKWWDNVSRGPVWDSDDLFLNYVTHPYAGAIYYMGARSAGVNAAYSFLYSFALSTFFWEYGIESFAERPSIQDLVITPVAGALFGELFYKAKRNILKNDGKWGDSKTMGTVALFLMDPMTEVTNLIWDDDEQAQYRPTFNHQPMLSHEGVGYGIRFSLSF